MYFVNSFLLKKAKTYCAIAKVLQDANSDYAEIYDVYMKALECAQGSGKPSTQVNVTDILFLSVHCCIIECFFDA